MKTHPRVFVGAPAVLTQDQTTWMNRWWQWLTSMDFEIVRISRAEYRQQSLDQLPHRIAELDGAVFLGFGQVYSTAAVWRPGTPEQAEGPQVWTSPWVHVEVGVALAFGMPLLLLADPGISDEVFCSAEWSTRVTLGDLRRPGLDCERWITAVERRHDS